MRKVGSKRGETTSERGEKEGEGVEETVASKDEEKYNEKQHLEKRPRTLWKLARSTSTPHHTYADQEGNSGKDDSTEEKLTPANLAGLSAGRAVVTGCCT